MQAIDNRGPVSQAPTRGDAAQPCRNIRRTSRHDQYRTGCARAPLCRCRVPAGSRCAQDGFTATAEALERHPARRRTMSIAESIVMRRAARTGSMGAPTVGRDGRRYRLGCRKVVSIAMMVRISRQSLRVPSSWPRRTSGRQSPGRRATGASPRGALRPSRDGQACRQYR